MKTKILLESWKSFLKEEDSLKIEKSEPKKFSIGLVPMSAKPFHKGHMFLVEEAIKNCEEVIIYVSTSDRSRKGEITIHGEDMKLIWEKVIKEHLPDNVECVYGGSPVGRVYKYLGDISNSESIDDKTYAIYTGQDDANRYQDKWWINIKDKVHVKEFLRGSDSPDISGTLMRSYLANGDQDKSLFLDGLPDMPLDDKEEIYNILTKRLN